MHEIIHKNRFSYQNYQKNNLRLWLIRQIFIAHFNKVNQRKLNKSAKRCETFAVSSINIKRGIETSIALSDTLP